jgi:hypothetical protein
MTNAKTVLELPVVTTVANTDRVLIIANAGNTAAAQTAAIPVSNFFQMPPQPDPSNSPLETVGQRGK